jgi:hypothetical protein
VKRWRDGGSDPIGNERDSLTGAPLSRERLGGGSGRSGLLVPGIAVACVAIAVLALAGRFLTSTPAPATPTPLPTPIAWLDKLVTPDPSATADTAPPLRVTATVPDASYIFVRGQPNHFTLHLRNTSGGSISLDPCPAYRIYLQGSDSSTAPAYALNCAGIGSALAIGESVDLDMVFTPAMTDPIGGQSVVWEWAWPDSVQGLAIVKIYIEG